MTKQSNPGLRNKKADWERLQMENNKRIKLTSPSRYKVVCINNGWRAFACFRLFLSGIQPAWFISFPFASKNIFHIFFVFIRYPFWSIFSSSSHVGGLNGVDGLALTSISCLMAQRHYFSWSVGFFSFFTILSSCSSSRDGSRGLLT